MTDDLAKPLCPSTETLEQMAVRCFDKALALTEREDRSAADERLMAFMSQSCLAYWMLSPERDDRRMLMGFCQSSLVQTLVGNPALAITHAKAALSHSIGLDAVYVGYANDAIARALSYIDRTAGAAKNATISLRSAERMHASI